MNGRLSLVTSAQSLPVTLAEAKAHRRVDDEDVDEDALLLGYIMAATAEVDGPENSVRRALLTQTWDLVLDGFPSGGDPIRLPLPPAQSVTSISYVDGAGDLQSWDSAEWTLDATVQPAMIYPSYGFHYPSTRAQRVAVTVRYVAGYGDERSDIPERLRLAILQLFSHFDEHREPMIIGQAVNEIPKHVDRLLAPYRFSWLA